MKKILLTAVALIVAVGSMAQTQYNFSAFNETYSNLSNPITLSDGDVWDDPEYIIPLGFDFQISTYTFNTLYIVSWGLGGVVSSSSAGTGFLPAIVPIGQDIVSLTDLVGNSTSPITYKIDGAPGSRIAKIEWQNFGFFEDQTTADFMNMQLWLYEGTNTIEYRFGPSAINSPNESFEGETGPSVALLSSYDFDNDELLDVAYVLTENTANPTVVEYGPGDEINEGALTGAIPDGTVYRFTPGVLGIQENFKLEFTIFPNPVQDILTISSNNTNQEVIFFNNLGQEIQMDRFTETSYNVAGLRAGLYFIQIKSDGAKVTKKFIKK